MKGYLDPDYFKHTRQAISLDDLPITYLGYGDIALVIEGKGEKSLSRLENFCITLTNFLDIERSIYPESLHRDIPINSYSKENLHLTNHSIETKKKIETQQNLFDFNGKYSKYSANQLLELLDVAALVLNSAGIKEPHFGNNPSPFTPKYSKWAGNAIRCVTISPEQAEALSAWNLPKYLSLGTTEREFFQLGTRRYDDEYEHYYSYINVIILKVGPTTDDKVEATSHNTKK